MVFFRFVLSLFLLVMYTFCYTQEALLYEEDFLETTSDVDKFTMYLDSIDKYLYRDSEVTFKAFSSCQQLIDAGLEPSDSLFFIYIMNQVLFKHNTMDQLGAYKVFVENDEFLESDKVPASKVSSADYFKAFTYMSIGDLESAQKSYYLNIESSKQKKDTSKIIANLYSLGQLYNDEDDFEAALKCYEEIGIYESSFNAKPTTSVLIQLEKAETQLNLENYIGALNSVEKGLFLADQHNTNVLANDLLMIKGSIYLKQKKIKPAEKVLKQLQSFSKNSIDPNSISNTNKFLAKLYEAKKMYPKAIQTHSQILATIDSTDFRSRLTAYSYLHDISKKMGDYKSAYSYLIAHNDLFKQKLEDEKRQKTAYLKIKYDSEQKEKDNSILAAQLLKNKTERQLLSALLGLIGLSLIILFGAFYQKQRYNKLLESEVKRRTSKLRESNELYQKANEELDEFNRILSHDLKEPLRSIVGFSQLAANNTDKESKAHNYLEIVKKSGEQLSDLIEDVGKFRNTNTIDHEDKILINIKNILQKTIDNLELKYPDKNLTIHTSDHIPAIQGNPSVLMSIFSNILENSVKFNEQENVEININYVDNTTDHVFEIKDNGIGVPEAYHDQIFDMFTRLNNRNKYSGSGLGLSVVRKMISDLGGSISILKSQLNVGTTMQLKLAK